jgi:hypothetical protein
MLVACGVSRVTSVGDCLGQLLLHSRHIRFDYYVRRLLTSKSGSRDGITIKERLRHTRQQLVRCLVNRTVLYGRELQIENLFRFRPLTHASEVVLIHSTKDPASVRSPPNSRFKNV